MSKTIITNNNEIDATSMLTVELMTALGDLTKDAAVESAAVSCDKRGWIMRATYETLNGIRRAVIDTMDGLFVTAWFECGTLRFCRV